MKKTLITVDNVQDFICQVEKRIYVDGMILTPGAKDELHKRGIDIIFSSCPEVKGCQAHSNSPASVCSSMPEQENERLFYGVAAMLLNDYGIKDPEKLKELSIKATKIIKENI